MTFINEADRTSMMFLECMTSEMNTLVIIAVFCLTYFDSQTFSQSVDCRPREYKNNGVCCPMCDKGTVVKTHCTLMLSSSVCVPCSDGTYMDHFNGETKCLRCTECDPGARMKVKKECTRKANAECECIPGYYCPNGDMCDMCIPQSICPKGTYVKVLGTSSRDNVCEDCPPGHYSNSEMSLTCTAWTKCSDQGLVEDQTGTSELDTICHEQRGHYVTIASFIAVCVLSLVVYRYVILRKENLKLSEEENMVQEPETNMSPQGGTDSVS
ncbi:tumor necrosis factor receptor superfamily member 14 [Hyperolius riggenbachi]|uniref:tumor necrosis factor receptor superfamily member 14 n=1 Tax=Hyperolius riggenbachi TaxID=752182 RepID=UPI0035A3B80F